MAVSPPRTVTLSIKGPLAPDDLPGVLERARALLQAPRVELLACSVGELAPDLLSVEALARIALTACRCGCRLELCDATPQLLALLALAGLADVLPGRPGQRMPGPDVR
jgi:hypothetical protein